MLMGVDVTSVMFLTRTMNMVTDVNQQRTGFTSRKSESCKVRLLDVLFSVYFIRVPFYTQHLGLNKVFNPVVHFMLIVSTILSVYCQFQLENCNWTVMRLN